METIKNIIQSFFTQNILGYIGILLIISVIVLGIIYNIRVKSKYEIFIKDFKDSNWIDNGIKGNKELKFLNSELKAIADEFKLSANKGTENINTEVIIQKNIDNKVLREESIANILPSISIALGLIGTFLGLTIAIMTTTGILSQGTQSMADFSRGMNAPLASMSSAFWTSIVGVIGSVILNSFNINMKRAKEDFYDVFEDYLDNVLFANYMKSDRDLFNDFMKKSMNEMTSRLEGIFIQGINNLVHGINRNTLDMTATVKGIETNIDKMNKHMKDLENLVSDFRVSVAAIRNPIKNFGEDLNNFSKISTEFCRSIGVSNNKFNVTSNNLEKSLNELSKSMMDNRREINKLCMRLEAQSNDVKRGYNAFNDVFKIIKEDRDKNTEIVSRQIDKLNEGYREFEKGVNKFSANVSNMKNEVSDGIYYALQRETQTLSNSIVDRLNVPLRDINIATEELNKSTNRIRRMGKVSEEERNNGKEIGRC
ncbi:hypothetical protein [Clostridium sp.]|uniref:hypothetical protein n=1 Tax=Clostridium sp. TaxID=1506 RepID=UPI002614D0C5|nr:hypothetical protein [Clostridium sp.]